MTNTMYTQAQFDARSAELAADSQRTREMDPAVQSARAAHTKATKDLEDLKSYVATLPLQRRLQFNGNVTQAKQAVTDAEKAIRTAENLALRTLRLAMLEAKNTERQQAQEAQQAKFASEQEAAAKQEMRTWYLSAGGLQDAFESAWPDMWKKELEQRTTENLAGAKRRLEIERGYRL